MRLLQLSLALLAVLAFGAGCSDEPSEAKLGKPVITKKGKGEKGDGELMVEKYRYDPTNKPDPFRSYVRQLVSIGQEDLTSPLQRFDLSQLTVTGIVWNMNAPRALIEDPTGKGYVIETGAPIGKNRGRIVEITDNRVVVKETYVDFEDRATTKEVDMYLYEGNNE